MTDPTIAATTGLEPPAQTVAGPGAIAVVFRVDGDPMAVLADRSLRVSSAQPLNRVPLLPQQCMGVAAFDGRVVPVIDLADLLDRPPVSMTRHDLIHAEVDGQPYAFAVDRVLQVVRWSADDWATWHGAPLPVVDLASLLGQELSPAREGQRALSVAVARPGSRPADPVARAIAGAASALVVATSGGNVRLPMSLVVEMHDDLPHVPVPDSRPELRGAAINHGRLVPRVSLDALLGLDAGTSTRAQPGAWVIVDAAGQRVALGVGRVVGASDAACEPMLDLEPMLAALLGPAGRHSGGPVVTQPAAATTRSRDFLLVVVGGQKCALPLASARHLHADCWVARAPVVEGQMPIFAASVGDRVIPVIPLARLLGLRRQSGAPQWIELALRSGWQVLVAVDRSIGVVHIEDAAHMRPPRGTMIEAMANVGPDRVWLLDPARIAGCTGWNPDEA
ncbi:MAG: chemotaxis protein CheW [Pseudomonadota bacterium]